MRPSWTLFVRWGVLCVALLLSLVLFLRSLTVTAASVSPATCTVVTPALNFRTGPGVNYNPPLRVFTRGTVLTPIARNAAATWIQVQIADTAETGWVSAAKALVQCNIAINELPTTPAPNTPNPTSSSAVVAPARSTPTPPNAGAATHRTITLLAPDNHNSITGGRWTFRWQPNFTLPPNTAFEVVFWRDNQDPLTQSQGGVPPTDKTEVEINLDILDQVRIIQSGLVHWGILLVQPQTAAQPYRRLAFLQGDFDFDYSPVPPTPTLTPTPTQTPDG
ncbi:MAG: hypothetical protein U0350_27280 [Caldilineaceae bacterium]